MGTVTIAGTSYEIYSSLDYANKYLAAEFSATAWQAETDDDPKKRALVTSSRLIDRLLFAGTKTDEDQAKAFPRTGLVGYDDDEVPQVVIDAEVVLANAIYLGQNVTGQQSTDSNIKRQQAGSVSIEYFRPVEDGLRLPLAVMELLAGLFGGSGVGGGVFAYGTDGCSITENQYGLNGPL